MLLVRGGRSEFLAAAWSVNVTAPKSRRGRCPHTMRFPSPVPMKEGFAVGWAKEGEALVARFGYRLKSGHEKVDAALPVRGWFCREVVCCP